MTDITRIVTGKRMSQIVIHNGTVYLAGQVGKPGESVAAQTQACLDGVDALLEKAGTDNTRILQTTIWLADMSDFTEMNSVWDAWVAPDNAPDNAPTRACGEAKLATPDYKVEIIIVAALP